MNRRVLFCIRRLAALRDQHCSDANEGDARDLISAQLFLEQKPCEQRDSDIGEA